MSVENTCECNHYTCVYCVNSYPSKSNPELWVCGLTKALITNPDSYSCNKWVSVGCTPPGRTLRRSMDVFTCNVCEYCVSTDYGDICSKTEEKIPDPRFYTCADWYLKDPDNKNSSVNPDYYQHEGAPETIDVIKAWTAELEGIEAVCTANIIKYISRWKSKNGAEDLRKLVWYAERLIEEIEKDQK